MKGIFGINSAFNEMEDIIPALKRIFSIAPDISNQICNTKEYPIYGQYIDSLDFDLDGSGGTRYNYAAYAPDETSIDDVYAIAQLGDHIASITRRKDLVHPISGLIRLCQHLCHNYKYPRYDEVKDRFLLTQKDYMDISKQIDERWYFDNAVEKYLSLQYLYIKSSHNPPTKLTKILKEFSYPGEAEKAIKKIASNFSSRRGKRFSKAKKLMPKKELENTFQKAEEIAEKSGIKLEYLNIFSRLIIADKVSLAQWLIDKSWTDQDSYETFSDIERLFKQSRQYKAKNIFNYSGFLGNFLNPSWSNSSARFASSDVLKWESIYDFMALSGLFLGACPYNPFSVITECDSIEDFFQDPMFKPNIENEKKFVAEFVPRGIVLSKQKENVVSLVHYIIERITNINLIHGIMSHNLEYTWPTSSDYHLHKAYSMIDNALVLAKYPLVDLRHGFLSYLFEDKESQSYHFDFHSYISYLIRYHIYFYFPLVNELFHSLLKAMIPFDYGDLEIAKTGRLFDGDMLVPRISYGKSNGSHIQLQNEFQYDPWIVFSMKPMESYSKGSEKNENQPTVNSTDALHNKYASQILNYTKRRIYYSFYEEIRSFRDFNFIDFFQEYKQSPMGKYIYEMDCNLELHNRFI